MGAYPKTITVFEKAFCLAIMWLEEDYDDKVWVVEADEDSGRLAMVGDQSLCREFNDRLNNMTQSVFDPLEAWRYYG